MKAIRAKLLLVSAFVSLLSSSTTWGQQVSGSITGTVRDTAGSIIPNAKITLVNVAQNDVREGFSNSEGIFLFNPLKPADYKLTIEVPGFKKYEQTTIKVFANDRITLGDITLQVGSISDSVTVAAESGQVQLKLAGGEKSGVLTGNQTVNLALLTRDFLQLTKTLPGVVQNGGVGGAVNGNRNNSNNLTVDGVTNIDTGSNGGQLATMNIDQIAEFKVLTNSQPAEFGRSSGAQIAVVTKGGTKDFHGTGYEFYRHESLNANSWLNNQRGIQKNRYRYNYRGFNIGGPAFIPGKFNKDKDKLFFFVGIEWQGQLQANSIRSVTVPTAAQRTGNFAGTLEGDGRTPVFIRDPLASGTCGGSTGGPACFANNIIPTNRISSDGQKILNFYPLPNAAGIDPSFNYQTAISGQFPRREMIYRGDYNINEKWRYYGRFLKTKSSENRPYGQWNADYNIPFAAMNFGNPGWSFVNNVTTTVNPTLTNEFIFGSSKNVLNIDPVDDTFKRSKLGLSYKMPFPDADGLDLIQNWRFGGVPNGPTSAFNGTPFRNFNHTYDITDNVAKIKGSHQFKFGIYMQKSLKDQTAFTPVNGTINFDRNTANPLDTNWAFSNAMIGVFRSLEQSNVVLNGMYRSWNVEWYAQDSWRVNRKLTIDYGLRFYWIQPQYDAGLQTSSFNPGLYQNGARAVLVQPFLNAAGQRVGRNPITGAEMSSATIGSIVNTGNGFVNGLYANGLGLAGKNGYPAGLINDRGLHYAPRIGIAWQFLDKTVLRAGAGVFFDRFQGNPVFDMITNPPGTVRPTLFDSTLASIASTQGTFFPTSIRGFDQGGHIPTTYQWNLSIQRQVGWQSVVEVGYVANIGRHLLSRTNLNAVPLGTTWTSQVIDPTTNGLLPTNFYRPYAGYGGVSVSSFGATSSYHSLQASWNRNMGKGVNFGIAYTFSKTLGLVDGDQTEAHPFNARMGTYGLLPFDVPHNLVFNYIYDVPKAAKNGNFLDNKVGRVVFNGWQVSGITTMASGTPSGMSFGVSGVGNLNQAWTGSDDIAPRVLIVGNPNNGPQNELQWFDTSTIRMPAARTSSGLDSAVRTIRLPGTHNWDVSLFKNIPLWSGDGKRFLQLRWEMFNAPNHTQFSGVNTAATFNAAGQITNLPSAGANGVINNRYGFGAINGVRDPRYMQLAAKIYW
jgi:hypothetical protein